MFNRHTDKNASLRTQAEQLLGHPWFHHPFGKVTRWKTLLFRYLFVIPKPTANWVTWKESAIPPSNTWHSICTCNLINT